ncbi:Phosphoglucomutase [Hibiscus syriacus]|uniref:Phosphoglucomutase n=1 Tax=Hibiscus syriacus TaxID=106335 RepID=A0A6A3B265_HIBSY|nr:Phosphoglucomutase [Hibiscus syriacus]
MVFKVSKVSTTPFEGQKPGTSGLRKKVKVFVQPHYLQNFVQSTFNALTPEKVKGATLVVSGDGRYFSKDAIQIIIKISAANGVRRVWVGQNGLLSTPAVSAVIRERVGVDVSNIVLISISHISTTGVANFTGPEGQFDVEVFDSANDHVKLMKFFVTPSDSVAIIAANAVNSIPYFSSGLKGVARSMPTSAALDVVAKHLNLKFFEVPTGWKFFGNLMDAGLCSICGEESFGTGSDHIREKDGIWAVLAWLSILAYKNKENLNGDKLVTVEDIVRQHWATYAKDLMAYLVNLQSSLNEINSIVKGDRSDVSNVVNADEFEYKDPVDGSVSKHQGIRFLFEDGSRLVFRLSGTGSEGATIRLYIEQYEKDSSKTGRDSQEALAPLVEVALKLSKLQEFTGRSAPTVVT